MALAGNIGMTMTVVQQIPNPAAILFGEDQGRYVVTTRDPTGCARLAMPRQLVRRADWDDRRRCADVRPHRIAVDRSRSSLADLRSAHEGFFPKLMGADAALA